jgi:hypothetical protein
MKKRDSFRGKGKAAEEGDTSEPEVYVGAFTGDIPIERYPYRP